MTIEELYGKVLADDELKKSLNEALQAGTVLEWVAAQGVDATEEELSAYIKSIANSRELSDEELDKVAGGGYVTGTAQVFISVMYFFSC